MKINRRVFAVALFGVLMCGFYACSSPSRRALGDAPEFSLQDLRGGTLNSEELKGQIVIVDFWATWCEPCISEIPNYKKLREKLTGKGVEILGIALESSMDDVRTEMAKLAIPYPVVMGDDKVAEGFGGLSGFPTTFVVDKNWKIYKKYLGLNPKGKDEKIKQLEADIAALLAPSQ